MIGQELGNYRVLAPIGKGGMASVYVGQHQLLGSRVAIKVLQERHLDNPAIERRFFNEAQVIAAIKHPNIVEIYDFGRIEGGAAYIVMELLEGETLRDRIRQGVIPERQSIIFARQLAAALAEAHRMGVIHRDLKPDNIFIVRDDEVEQGQRVKLLDFGIAKRMETLGQLTEHTATGILVGTPAYMSPEQCKGLANIDGRSDVYSLGVVLYRMITNHLPFEAGATGEIIGKHLYVTPPPVREINPEISPGLEDVVMRCLHKSPRDRFQSMDELAAALAELSGSMSGPFNRLSSAPLPPAPPLPSPDPVSMVTLSTIESFHPGGEEISTLGNATGERRPYRQPPRKKSWLLVAAAGCAAALILGAFALRAGGDGEAAPKATSAGAVDEGKGTEALEDPPVVTGIEGAEPLAAQADGAVAATDEVEPGGDAADDRHSDERAARRRDREREARRERHRRRAERRRQARDKQPAARENDLEDDLEDSEPASSTGHDAKAAGSSGEGSTQAAAKTAGDSGAETKPDAKAGDKPEGTQKKKKKFDDVPVYY